MYIKRNEVKELITAELRGKIPSVFQNHEDVLTSSVIGMFQYLSSSFYLQLVLESSQNMSGQLLQLNSPIQECSFIFWPKLENSEPDVLIHLTTEAGSRILICIEAKYWSDKSSYEDLSIDLQDRGNHQRDQLAREMEDIHSLNSGNGKWDEINLLYLTNHTAFPLDDIKASISHVKNDLPFNKEQIYWLPWRNIHYILSNIKTYLTKQDSMLLGDLVKLLEKKELQCFSGFQKDIRIVSEHDHHTYNSFTTNYYWDSLKEVKKLNWHYGGITHGSR